MARSSYQFIDPTVLFDAAGSDLHAFRSLSATFLEIAPPIASRLEYALKTGDTAAVAHESHALKGTAMLVGAAELTLILKNIEILARCGDSGETLAYLDETKRLFNLVRHEVAESVIHFTGIRATPVALGRHP